MNASKGAIVVTSTPGVTTRTDRTLVRVCVATKALDTRASASKWACVPAGATRTACRSTSSGITSKVHTAETFQCHETCD